MKNPLNKRLPRELKDEIGKYLVILILLVAMISFVSGFLVADGSMLQAYNESFEKYNIEDGHFRLENVMNKAQRKSIEEYGIKLYDNYYIEETLDNGSTMRIFANREQVNKVCLMEGTMPEKADEIAVDRMYADNNNLKVGDKIGNDKQSWKITGLVALSDYSALFSNNNDSMFDSVKFGVAVVAKEAFEEFSKDDLFYSYSWLYDNPPKTEKKEKDISENLMEDISKEVTMEEYVPRYMNQAINFTGEDMGSDRAMIIVLLYMVIVIVAFVFGITISNTISSEANVIGTLRASGYTRAELIRHYMAMPVIVTVIGAVIGNILGYTVMKDVCAGMYYGSYSLPTYVTIWNGEAFVLTTIVPVVIMLVITFFVLHQKLKLSPLKFIRRDLSKKKQKHAVRLNKHIPFFQRFRMRIIFQNMKNYLVLFIGIMFANLLLMFGMALPEVLNHYQHEIENGMLSNYQYMLQVPVSAMSGDSKLETMISMMQFSNGVETENEDAEKFSAYTLDTLGDVAKSEEILLYGIDSDSKYVPLDFKDSEVYISSAYAEKYKLKAGDSITLKEKYEKKKYTFKVGGIYNYSGSLTVFMSKKMLNKTFDLGDDYFCGYFSDSKITDIKSDYIGSVIDLESLTKISRQLNVSMGSMMYLVDGFAIGIFLVLIYLLSKIIIEKNAQSISMAKILGYTNLEISRLYILSTSIMVILSLLVSMPLVYNALLQIFYMMMLESFTGWLPLYIPNKVYVEMFILGLATYAIVAALEYRKIKKVPMDEALKNVE